MPNQVLSPIQFRNEKGQFIKGAANPFSRMKGRYVNPLKGKKMPEQWKAKLRKPKSVSHTCSEDTKAKLRAKAILRVGPKSSRWKGGLTAAKSARRRARLQENGGSHSNGEWETLKARYNWACVCCKKGEPEIKLTKDHIVSLMEGGSNNIENIQPLCGRCNVKKHTNSIRYA